MSSRLNILNLGRMTFAAIQAKWACTMLIKSIASSWNTGSNAFYVNQIRSIWVFSQKKAY